MIEQKLVDMIEVLIPEASVEMKAWIHIHIIANKLEFTSYNIKRAAILRKSLNSG